MNVNECETSDVTLYLLKVCKRVAVISIELGLVDRTSAMDGLYCIQ